MSTNLSNIGEKVLLMGFFLTPFTSFRFGDVGPGEILILAAALIALFSGGGALQLDGRIQIFYRFWIGFLAISILGLYYNNFFASAPSGRPASPVFDFLAYVFILLSIVFTGHYSRNRMDFSIKFFRRLFLYWSFTYGVLYVVSFYTPTIFGMPLRYYHFFSPLVENVHQAASITCVLGFVMFFLGAQSYRIHVKIFCFVSAALFIMMALDSGSTKAMLGVISGAIISFGFLIGYRTRGKGRFYFNIISLFLMATSALVLFALFSDSIILMAYKFFSENDGGGAREALYSVGFEHGLDSLVVGFGPGSHAPFGTGFSDAHNTVLTIFLQAGLLGISIFALFIGRLVKKLSVNFALFGGMASIGIYIIGGDILRRLPVWIVMMGIVYFAADMSVRPASSAHSAKWKPGSGLNACRKPD